MVLVVNTSCLCVDHQLKEIRYVLSVWSAWFLAAQLSVPGVWWIQYLWKSAVCNYQRSLYLSWCSFIFNEPSSISGGLHNCLCLVEDLDQCLPQSIYGEYMILNCNFCVTCRNFAIDNGGNRIYSSSKYILFLRENRFKL